MDLLSVAVIVVFLNLPFGYWRANAEAFSRQWFLSVHLPVLFVVALRVLSGLGWHFATFPVMIGAFFSGQFLGGRLHRWWTKHAKTPVTSCLVWDMVTGLKNVHKGGMS
jgi:hypothetical protein